MIFKLTRWIIFLLAGHLAVTENIFAQKNDCNTITAGMNYRVSSVKIVGRWIPEALQKKIEQVVGVGQLFDPATVNTAQEIVRDEIVKGEINFAIKLLGSSSVLYITSDVCPVADSAGENNVQVTIHPYYLRIDLYNIGNNILPIPRTAKPSFYSSVPDLLLATSPVIGLVNDRRVGLYGYLQTSTDLLHITGMHKPLPDTKRNLLNLDFNFRKSFAETFYNIAGALQFVHALPSGKGIGWNFGVLYAKSLQPLSIVNYDNELARIFTSITGKGKILFMDKYVLGSGIEFSQNDYSSQTIKYRTPEAAFDFNAFGDGRVGNGLARLGVWFNAGVPKKDISLDPYQRIAGKLGYALPLGKGHNSVDLETIASFGYTWGTPPVYGGYFAGNASPGFLYSPLQSFTNMSFPSGPVIRSLGEKEGGFHAGNNAIEGGTSYWGINLNFSIPISKWARPLIPDIVMQEEPRLITMRSAVKAQVKTAQSFIADDLALNGGLSDDAADSTAAAIVNKDIRPTIDYLADRANIYSVKPIVFFDLGEINKRNADNKIWAATGVGLQINIVNARFNIGYLQTLFPKVDASKGNFLLQFSVQNFY